MKATNRARGSAGAIRPVPVSRVAAGHGCRCAPRPGIHRSDPAAGSLPDPGDLLPIKEGKTKIAGYLTVWYAYFWCWGKVGGVSLSNEEEREMTAKEFADIYGKDGSWAQRMAKKAVRQGKSYPVKRGNYWFATRSQWEAILKESGIRLRNRKKKK